MSITGHVLGGRYKLDTHLADGGMGAVWTAKDLTLGTEVAVKLMSVEGAMRPDLRARFEQEAKAVALLRDAHVVEVLAYGTDGDMPYIVMELLDGVDLLGVRDHMESWPLSEVANLVIQAAQGLGAAHRAGLIHRDVKPANIFLALSDEADDVVVKIIDFGIAKWAENKAILTASNVALGSPSYMSPEQIRGQQVDARVDVWALAVVAFSLVTGNMPFVGRNGPDIAKQVVLGNRAKITPPVPDAARLERFFARAFAQDPAARHRSVEELAGELVLVAGAPTPLRAAARAVARAQRDPDGLDVTQGHAEPRDDAVTNRLVRAAPDREPSSERAVEDLEETEIDDRLRASSGGGAGRTR